MSGYTSSDSLLVSFCYFVLQRVSFPIDCRSSLSVQRSKQPGYPSSLVVLSVSLFYHQKQTSCRLSRGQFLNLWKSGLSVVYLYEFGHLRIRRTQTVLAFGSVSVLLFTEGIVSTKLSFNCTS